jgi:hypothetical protein
VINLIDVFYRHLHSSKIALMQDEASDICDACGEGMIIPLDISAGGRQEFAEDCPMCCPAYVIHVEIDEYGKAAVWAEPGSAKQSDA